MANTNLKPKIRFIGFEGDWENFPLKSVAKYRNGKAHENEIDKNGKYIVVNSKFVSTDGDIKKYSNNQIEPLYSNEIAFVLSDVPNGRALARTFLVPENSKYTLNQRIAGITPNEEINTYYLYTRLNRNPYFLQFDDGAKQTNLSIDDVLEYSDYYPSIMEQKKIGLYLENLDSLITQHQNKYDKLKTIKKACLEKMFPKEGQKVPEIRFNGFTEPWEQCKLGDMARFSKGNGYSKSDLQDQGTPIILYGRLYTKYEFAITEVDTFVSEKPGSVISNGGEVIIPASGETAEDIARAATVENKGIILGGDLNIVHPGEELISQFLSLVISNGTVQKELASKAQGKSVVHIHNSDIEKVTVNFPNLAEQGKIVQTFKELDHLITLHQRELQKLKNIKKALLEKMFV